MGVLAKATVQVRVLEQYSLPDDESLFLHDQKALYSVSVYSGIVHKTHYPFHKIGFCLLTSRQFLLC